MTTPHTPSDQSAYPPIPNETEQFAKIVLDAAFAVHSAMGPGLLESVYETCLNHEIQKKGLDVQAQVSVPVIYDGLRIDSGYRLDLLVNNRVVVEIKSVEQILPVHQAQLLTYLKLGGYRLGFLINFNVRYLKNGIQRFVR